ncbi:MAG: hypothetical protein HC792_00785 [Acaryochloridaceae cyanobacterium CSU_5_19]|nr:hypothetical protein [Acaryochloridaceae cyanobacterium CSU_5_19]
MQNPEPRESWSVESRLVSDDEPLIEQNLDYEQSLESLGEDLDPALSAPPLPDFTSDRLELPEIPVEVPPLRLQISPGLILPPELYSPTPEEKEGYRPQLPTFPHLNHWQELSFSELSLALGRLRWSKIDAYGETIDLDFHSLALQQRFLETLNSLAANDQAPEDLEILWDGEAQSVEDEDAIAQDRLEASQSVAVPSSSSEPG